MNYQQIKDIALEEINESLNSYHPYFKAVPGAVIVDDLEEGSASIEFYIHFSFGNCKRSHTVIIGYNEDDGVGLEYGEDAEIEQINSRSIMMSMYFDLATTDLEDKYLT